jgi:23S rRNA pseudouridine1911/1915/1917 synthase
MLEELPTIPLSNQAYILDYYVHPENLHVAKSTVLNYLQLHLPLLEEQQIIDWLTPLTLTIDQQRAEQNSLVSAGQTISINLPQHFEQQVALDWQIIWENDEILAVYKPAPLAVSRTTRNLYDTLIGLIRRQTPYYSAQLLHRLDIETSGLILIAKNKASDIKHKKNLKQLIEIKTYHAIVKGVPQWSEFTTENELAERLDSDIRCKMYVVDPLQDRAIYKKPKQSKTHFKLLKTQAGYSLIECQLFTGRKHQIRAQLAHLNLPIVGDKIYSHNGDFFLKRLAHEIGLKDQDYQILGAKNHLLRAVRLGLRLDDCSPLITLQCDSFADDILKEIFPIG